jgi:hypothetical protein
MWLWNWIGKAARSPARDQACVIAAGSIGDWASPPHIDDVGTEA